MDQRKSGVRVILPRCVSKLLVQRYAFHILHHDERVLTFLVLADVVNSDDGGMREATRRFRLQKKTLPKFFLLCGGVFRKCDGLNGHHTINFWISGLVNDTHSSPANFCQDSITTKIGGRSDLHRITREMLLIQRLKWYPVNQSFQANDSAREVTCVTRS